MTTTVAKPGRNDLCSCGSGKKYKRCCGAIDTGTEDAASRFFGIAAVLAGLMLVGGAVVFAMAFFGGDETAGKKVWSPEHGHYHTVGGSGASDGSTAGRGGVLNPEGNTPVRGALDGFRESQLDEARQKAAAAPPAK